MTLIVAGVTLLIKNKRLHEKSCRNRFGNDITEPTLRIRNGNEKKRQPLLWTALIKFQETTLDYYFARCSARIRSKTVLTGLNVIRGTSTKRVFQLLIEPFHSPGSSCALRVLPS